MIQRPDFDNACQTCGGEAPDGVTECARCVAYAALLEIHEFDREHLRGQTDEF